MKEREKGATDKFIVYYERMYACTYMKASASTRQMWLFKTPLYTCRTENGLFFI